MIAALRSGSVISSTRPGYLRVARAIRWVGRSAVQREPRVAPEVERYLLRQRLREDQADRKFYTRTKRELAGWEWPSMQHYAEAKTEVIETGHYFCSWINFVGSTPSALASFLIVPG
jgi:hypothetical protein